MDIDHSLLNALLFEPIAKGQSIDDRFRAIEGAQHTFGVDGDQVYRFIRSHVKAHKKLPGVTVLKSKFPNFSFGKVEEPFAFYLTEAGRLRNQNFVLESIGRIELLLDKGQTDKAIREWREASLKATTAVDTEPDTGMVSDAKTVVADYLALQKQKVIGLATGISAIDKATGGLTESDFMVIIARPGSYKTFLATWISTHAALSRGAKVLFVSREMTPRQLRHRFIGYFGHLSYERVKLGKLTAKELKAYEEQTKRSKGDIIIVNSDPTRKFDLQMVASKVEEHSPDLIVLDALYRFGQAGWEDATNTARQARDIGLDYQRPVLATWQVSRKGGTTDDPLAAAAYADGLVQDASIVIEQKRQRDEVLDEFTNKTECKCIKSRDSEDGFKFFLTYGFDKMGVVEGIRDNVKDARWNVKFGKDF